MTKCCVMATRRQRKIGESQIPSALVDRPQQQQVGLRHGCGTPRSLQIFLAKWSFTSLWRGTALRLF